MRKLFIITILVGLLPMMAVADTYSSLWKKVAVAQDKDMPQSELALLRSITKKALADKEWGQFIKAELSIISTQSNITPDSVAPMVKSLERNAMAAEKVDPVLAAVYNTCLGTIYKNGWMDGTMPQDSIVRKSSTYYTKALADRAILAKAKAKNYEPLLVEGAASLTFDNDLLHVVAFEADRYDIAREWYAANGNRPAACLSAYYQIQKERREDVREVRKSKYKACLDSLINEYRDIPEAGEVAIERFNFMNQATDASAQEKVDYIDYAVRTWPTWPRMAILYNARDHITLPSFHAYLPETTVIPNKEIPVYITSLVNLHSLHISVTKVNVTGEKEYNLSDEEDMKVVNAAKDEFPIYYDDRAYYGLPDYKEIRDTLTIRPLPIGVYMVEFATNNSRIAVERALIHVTNLQLLDMDMPGKKIRLIAVNATDGTPFAGARISMKLREWKNGKLIEDEQELISGANGEVTFEPTLRPYLYRLTTLDDTAMQWTGISTSWPVKSADDNAIQTKSSVYTDRAIYRPGQKIHASVIIYNTCIAKNEYQTREGVKVTLRLKDAKGKDVESETATTDQWGVATMTFQIPETVGKTGLFTFQGITGIKNCTIRKTVRVEEYKRPTFTVSIDDYTEAYKDGDTITVVGHAQTYSGVPVQGATVKFSTSSDIAPWWRIYNEKADIGDRRDFDGETTTLADGSFLMRVPVEKPVSDSPRFTCFYAINVNASVTSIAGETHTGNLSLPLSTNPTALIIDGLPQKVCLEQLPEVRFLYLNNAGKNIEGNVTYNFDSKKGREIKANENAEIDFSSLAEGQHTLNLYCGEDSVSKDFVLFSLKDKAPVIDTPDWFYDTVGEYKNSHNFHEGEAVRMQIGTTRQNQTVYYAVATETEVLEEGAFILSNANMNRSITYRKEWGDGIAMRYSWVCDGKIYTHAQRLHKPEPDKTLKLEWSTFRDKVQPGQKEEWTLRIKNPDGSPASAHLIASVYDKSLDVLQKNAWTLMIPSYSFTPSISASQRNINSSVYLYGEQTFRPLVEPTLDFFHFDFPEFVGVRDDISPRRKMIAGIPASHSILASKSVAMLTAADDNASDEVKENNMDETVDVDIPVRTNLDETATYQADLVTDKDGRAVIKFTLPESLTTWRFLGLAHDKVMNNGTIDSEAVAQKQLMIQPNMPRFIREGDKAEIAATITNTTSKLITGTTSMIIKNAATDKVVYTQKLPFIVGGNKTIKANFSVPTKLAADMYIIKVVAQSKSFSDGEQQYLPVLSYKEMVTTTRAITQTKPGQKVIDLGKMFGKGTSDESVTLEYTNNPAWLMIDALPAAVKECKDRHNAVSLSTALYAACLVGASPLTPLLKAKGENPDSLKETIGKLRVGLKSLQNEDGSFSWWPAMPGNVYVTTAVVRNLVRLDYLLGKQMQNSQLIEKSMNYLAAQIAKEVAELKKAYKDNKKKVMPSDLAMDYLYLQALRSSLNSQNTLNTQNTQNTQNDINYLLSLLQTRSKELSIYGKANMAVAFALMKDGGDMRKAQELIESVMQYSTQTEEMGRYFDTKKAHYSWCSYKIPTETAAIEALLAVRPEDTAAIAEMRQWLLNEKRTQQWDTPVNTTSAIYAFLKGNKQSLDDVCDPARITLDGKVFNTSAEKKGYFKTTEQGRYNTLKIDKTSGGMSWGAVSTQALQAVGDVETSDENQLKVSREIVNQDGKSVTDMKVGDRVKVRITLNAGRDYDFVEVVDNRAACLEPVNQISGYRHGCYTAPADRMTSYYFDKLPKGKHIIETEYFVDRAGSYQTGLTTARCSYAPEFSSRDKAVELKVLGSAKR